MPLSRRQKEALEARQPEPPKGFSAGTRRLLEGRGRSTAEPQQVCVACGGTRINSKGGPCEPCLARENGG